MLSRHRRRKATLRQFKILGARQAWRCNRCQQRFDSVVEVDHRIPLSLGGSNDLENLEILCVVKTQAESIEPFLDKLGAMTCRFCKVKFSKYFTHQCRTACT